MEQHIGKCFYQGDSHIKVLSVVPSDQGEVLVCLRHSDSHNLFSVLVMNQSDFNEHYKGNETEDLPPLVASHILTFQ